MPRLYNMYYNIVFSKTSFTTSLLHLKGTRISRCPEIRKIKGYIYEKSRENIYFEIPALFSINRTRKIKSTKIQCNVITIRRCIVQNIRIYISEIRHNSSLVFFEKYLVFTK